MPFQHRLFGAFRKCDATAIALMEARDEAEAEARAAYVLGRLGFGEWEEVDVVEVRAVPGAILRVPTSLDAFFKAAPPGPRAH